jgi:hypothetical protein
MTIYEIEEGVSEAAKQLGAKYEDVMGFYRAGDEWDAETAEELTGEIVQAWQEAQAQAQVRL